MYVESEDSRLDDEIANIRIEIELILTEIRQDKDRLDIIGKKIKKSLNDDPMYARKEVFFEQIRTETQITNDYIEKTKKMVSLRNRYLELLKKRVTK